MGKRIRTVIGLSVAGVAVWLLTAWLLTPGLLAITSTRAVVNARILSVHSPIDGTVATVPPAVGKAVARGATLLEVENPLVDDSHLEELKTESATLAERVAALRDQERALEALKDQLAADAQSFHQATVRRIETQLMEARAVADATDAFLRQRQYKKEQLARLYQGSNVSQLEMVTAELALEAAQSKAAQAHAAVQRWTQDLAALRGSRFGALGDARNDVPYSQQRAHEIALRLQDTRVHIQEYSARATQIVKQLAIEAGRVKRQGRARLLAPFDGIVWRQAVAQGSAVGRDAELMELLDASEIFVDALVDERYFGDVHPGDSVTVKLIGSHAEVSGTVREVLGQVSLGESKSLAAEILRPGRHEIHLLVALGGELPQADHFHLYHIGQPARVRFSRVGVLARIRDWVSP